MANSWYLVKYVPDLFRNEPQNVGVVVVSGDSYATKFMGERPDGVIDGRRISSRISALETYKAWVGFIKKAVRDGNLDDRIDRLSRRSLDSFLIEHRGPLLGDHVETSMGQVAHELFVSLVSEEPGQATATLEEMSDSIISKLAVLPDRLERGVDYRIAVRGDAIQDMHFDYRYVNGKVTLIDRISLTMRPGRQLSQSVNDLLFRIEQVESHANVHNFVALYSSGDEGIHLEKQLQLLNKYANTVDVTSDEAPRTVGEILGVPTLMA